MKKNLAVCIAALAPIAALTVPLPVSAQQPRYKLIDMGTFGGPQSFVNPGSGVEFGLHVTVLNDRGEITGFADTSNPDPFPNYCFGDCNVAHAFRSNKSGVLTDLSALPGGGSSLSTWITDNGLMAGLSENGETDPLYPGLPQVRAVLWQGGKIRDLGTLPEGGYESAASSVNSLGQVVGVALNRVPDGDSMQPGLFNLWGGALNPPYGYEARAFRWDERGGMQDLGTLGGRDAQALLINQRGQILGHSYTGSNESPFCLYPLATDSFLWDRKNGMVNLGTLGGTCTLGFDLNQKGQVVGVSNLQGDQAEHAFLWSDGVLNDLGGSLGGSFTGTSALNERGEAAGYAYFPDDVTFHAVLWRRIGEMTDLGVLGGDQCSFATAINDKGVIAGTSISDCSFENPTFTAFLWKSGSMFDLNDLVAVGSPLYLGSAETINDRGEIAGIGVDAQGNEHAYLLVPCEDDHPGDCERESRHKRSAAPIHSGPVGQQAPAIHMMLRKRMPPLWRNATAFRDSTIEPNGNRSSQEADIIGDHERTSFALQRGVCAVVNGKLTGRCIKSYVWACSSGKTSACPYGAKAINPRKVFGFCGLIGTVSLTLDAARGCSF
jgi:probable HAF family extracellular repeat protein